MSVEDILRGERCVAQEAVMVEESKKPQEDITSSSTQRSSASTVANLSSASLRLLEDQLDWNENNLRNPASRRTTDLILLGLTTLLAIGFFLLVRLTHIHLVH